MTVSDDLRDRAIAEIFTKRKLSNLSSEDVVDDLIERVIVCWNISRRITSFRLTEAEKISAQALKKAKKDAGMSLVNFRRNMISSLRDKGISEAIAKDLISAIMTE